VTSYLRNPQYRRLSSASVEVHCSGSSESRFRSFSFLRFSCITKPLSIGVSCWLERMRNSRCGDRSRVPRVRCAPTNAAASRTRRTKSIDEFVYWDVRHELSPTGGSVQHSLSPIKAGYGAKRNARSPKRCCRANFCESVQSVLIRSPGLQAIGNGAATVLPWPRSMSCRKKP
jgi:hypothetical protein